MQGRHPRAGAVALLALWMAGWCWMPQSAHAQQTPAYTGATVAADVLIQKGIELRKAGEDRRALAEFERAFSPLGSVRALAQMALAEQALGLWREANEHLQRALLRTDEPWIAEHRAALEAAEREIRSQLGWLEISCNVAGAEVRLNGVVLGLTPLARPVPLVVGANVIIVSKPGFFQIARQVGIDAGRLSRLNVVLTSNSTASLVLAAEPPPREGAAPPEWRAAAPAESDRPAREAFFYAVFGLAALGLSAGVTGSVLRELTARRHRVDRRNRVEDVRRADESPEQLAAVRRGEALAVGGFASAAVFGLTAAFLWLSQPGVEEQVSLGCAPGLRLLASSSPF